jgi:hypothetical protein
LRVVTAAAAATLPMPPNEEEEIVTMPILRLTREGQAAAEGLLQREGRIPAAGPPRAVASSPDARLPASSGRKKKPKPGLQLGPRDLSVHWWGKAVRISVVVDPEQLRGIRVPTGCQYVYFRVKTGEGDELVVLRGRLRGRTVRRAVASLEQFGAERLSVVVGGRVSPRAVAQLEDVGLVALPKAQRAPGAAVEQASSEVSEAS